MKGKPHLTPDEVLRVGVAVLLRGVDNTTAAELLGLNNSGRITEAAIAMQWASENHMTIYRHILRQKKRRKQNGGAETGNLADALLDDSMKLLGSELKN